ncbi:MAG: phage baseplate assembly protein V [Streptosporangiaceae bacterium]|jgi:phage protein D
MSKEAAPATTTVTAPVISIGADDGRPLSGKAKKAIQRAVIDTHLHLPDMFEVTFLDTTGTLLTDAGISIGTRMRLKGIAADSETSQVLIDGEVTCLEATCHNLDSYSIVRGYDLCHRLQRTRRTRAFHQSSDSEIAEQVVKAAGLTQLAIESSGTIHDFVGQCNQTDWEFLSQRAREIGYEAGISCGTFYFRRASSVATAGSKPVELTFREDLRRFLPRVTAGNLAQGVEVRVWDPLQAKVISQVKDISTGTARPGTAEPESLGKQFVSDTPPGSTAQPVTSSAGDEGPPPSSTAHVVCDLPVATGSAIDGAATVAATALADQVASTFAEAEGEAVGDPGIQPGTVLKISGVPHAFGGSWLVTNARHVFDLSAGGYATEFVVSGRHDRSLLGLASASRARTREAAIPGVCCGVVTNIDDGKGRVRLVLPWLSPDYETDWAPVIQFGAGKRSGAMFLPEVGDEVLVGFEFGDPRRPYVIGGIVNNASGYTLGGPAVEKTGQIAAVARRGFVSAAGNRLVFADKIPPGDAGGPPEVSAITLGTGDGTLSLSIDQVAGTVTLSCSPAAPGSKTEKGTLNIRCGTAGTINVTAGQGGTVNIDGGANLNLKAEGSISIQSQGSVSIQGSGQVSIKGAQIALN